MSFHRVPLGQKIGKVVSEPIRDSAKGKDCTMRSPWCRHHPDTVVFCHAPVRKFGLGGMGMKVPDIFGYYGCDQCHAHEQDMGWDDLFRAVCETQMHLLRAGILTIRK